MPKARTVKGNKNCSYVIKKKLKNLQSTVKGGRRAPNTEPCSGSTSARKQALNESSPREAGTSHEEVSQQGEPTPEGKKGIAEGWRGDKPGFVLESRPCGRWGGGGVAKSATPWRAKPTSQPTKFLVARIAKNEEFCTSQNNSVIETEL